MNRILIAEDEDRIARFIDKGLRANSFVTTVVGDGNTALQQARSGNYDLLVLDIGLPGRDGYSVLRELREARVALPMIILTARDSVRDTVAGLEGGADDYMTKPFRFEELLARPAAPAGGPNGRRRADPAQRGRPVPRPAHRRAQTSDGRTVDLSAREFGLLELLLCHPGQVLSREQMLDHVWGFDFDPGSNVVDVYIRQLRRKIGADMITTVRGMGYRCG